MTEKKTELLGLNRTEIENFAVSIGEKKFHGRQIYAWIYQKRTSDFALMTDLSKSLRMKLPECAEITFPVLTESQNSSDGFTRKLRFTLKDLQSIESVLMRDKDRITLCVSTQVGCALGCMFCATGTMGFKRNLSAGEIVGQYLSAQTLLKERITNVVFMGMGEPLLNYDNLAKAVGLLTDPQGTAVSSRKLTVSTAGIIPGIERMTEDQLPVKLAVSLNAPDNLSRTALMPINKKYPLKQLFQALHRYEKSTRHRITFEYVVIGSVNDSLDDAKKLKRLLGGFTAKLNLIPFNTFENSEQLKDKGRLNNFKRPDKKALQMLAEELERPGMTVIQRKSQGIDISAACGQLCLKKIRPD